MESDKIQGVNPANPIKLQIIQTISAYYYSTNDLKKAIELIEVHAGKALNGMNDLTIDDMVESRELLTILI